MKKIFLLIVPTLLLLTLGVFTACQLNQKKVKRQNILRVSLRAEPSTFHFASSNKGSAVNANFIIPWIFDGLMRKGEHDIPELSVAYKVDISEDHIDS